MAKERMNEWGEEEEGEEDEQLYAHAAEFDDVLVAKYCQIG